MKYKKLNNLIVTIHVVHAVVGTSNYEETNKNVSKYNKSMDAVFNKNILVGDVNMDGEIEITDATLLQRYLVQLANNFGTDQLIAADVDGDGSVDVTDATLIQRYIADKPVSSLIGTYNNGKENTNHVKVVTDGYYGLIAGTSKTYCNSNYFSSTPVFGYAYTNAKNAEKYTKDGKHGTVVKKVNNNNYGYDNGLHYTVNSLECMGNWIINNSK